MERKVIKSIILQAYIEHLLGSCKTDALLEVVDKLVNIIEESTTPDKITPDLVHNKAVNMLSTIYPPDKDAVTRSRNYNFGEFDKHYVLYNKDIVNLVYGLDTLPGDNSRSRWILRTLSSAGVKVDDQLESLIRSTGLFIVPTEDDARRLAFELMIHYNCGPIAVYNGYKYVRCLMAVEV